METLDKQEESQKQVEFADKILISKEELVNDVDYQALRARLVRINPRATIAPVDFGQTDLKELLDISGFNLNTILDIDPEFLAEEHPDARHDHDHGQDHDQDHDHEHEHEHEHHHDHQHAHQDDKIRALV